MNYPAYIDIAKQIRAQAPGVKHIDLFNDQYNRPKESNPFNTPAVFVEFMPTPWRSTMNGVQEGMGGFRIHVVFTFIGNSHNIESFTQEQLDALFLNYTITKKIHNALSGFAPANCTQMERTSSMPDHNHDELLIEVMEYSFTEYDDSADEYGDYIETLINDIIITPKFLNS
jgi:hypothetical protein